MASVEDGADGGADGGFVVNLNESLSMESSSDATGIPKPPQSFCYSFRLLNRHCSCDIRVMMARITAYNIQHSQFSDVLLTGPVLKLTVEDAGENRGFFLDPIALTHTFINTNI